MKVTFLDTKGKSQTNKYDLTDDLFVESPNIDLISQYIYVYLGNQRQSNSKTKGRGEVRGGGRKPWRQKGTGRARHGSIRSPIWRGGGITFGPTGNQNYKKKMTKKMKKNAFKSVMTLKANENKIYVSEDPKVTKTKDARKYLENFKKDYRKILLVQQNKSSYHKYFKNIDNINIVRSGELNTYDVFYAQEVIFFESATDDLKGIFKNS
ncbi:50S ribosomal protein L4 [Candidatus Dojkabacteria bacterium]|nr:50S ribosomal protein L4 [Candidatus Dojkabacteria bacterium]